MVSSAYLRLLILLLATFIPACDSSRPAFWMMYSAYKLNKQGDNIPLQCTPFPIWNQSVVPCPVLNVASWLTGFSGDRWSGLVLPSLSEFSTVCCDPHKAFSVVNEAEVDVFLLLKQVEFPCFLHDPMNVGNFISGSSAFYKSILNIWKFMVHILLKPGLENFEPYFASV